VVSEFLDKMAPMALAYGQVNDSFAGFVSGDKSSSLAGEKKGQQVFSPSNAPTRGDGELAKTLPTKTD
jgi:hypothetical protein